MSAIVGIYQLNKEPISNEHGINLMNALKKFPADDAQTWQKEYIFLGCRAQWITPESVGERLPFYDHGRKLAVTADAIIDNREELFERLRVEHIFRKKMPDSELILRAYEKWGEDTPKYLIGDFAFMIWDEKKCLFFGARDFSGNRTLYYYRNQNRFAFCTTIEPLLTLPYVEKKLNEQWLAEFLAIPYMFDSVDASSTPYINIEQLPPAHSITVDGTTLRYSRFCTLTDDKPFLLKSNQEYEEAFKEVFQSAVAARIRTHRQVGASLSGGLDSGSVASFAAKALLKENKRLNTYSYIPPDDFVDWTSMSQMPDERPFIKSTVQFVGNINDHYLDFTGKSSLSVVDDWLDTMEVPYKFFENSFWLMGIYEKAYEQGVGLVLTGARGNFTVSWGPALDYYAVLLKNLNLIRLYHEINMYSKNTGLPKSRILSIIGKLAFPFLDRIGRSTEPYHFPGYINPEFAKRTDVFSRINKYDIGVKGEIGNIFELRKKHFERVFYFNASGTSATKLSLRYSLWNRDPTNDLRVVRFCLSVPEDQCVQKGLDRALIRRSMKNLLPDKVRLNQHVHGMQGADWVHRMAPSWNEFIKELQQVSIDPVISEFLDLQVVKGLVEKVRNGPRPEYALSPDYRVAMRCLIFHRFIKRFA